MEKYGFVYIWYDRKHCRYYIGCHWGHEDDGYVCSSSWMMQAYKRRPTDFKRRILSRITSSRQDLLLEENRWLQMIRDDELGKRFYNLTKYLNGHWSTKSDFYHWSHDPVKKKEIGEKIRQSKLGRSRSEETKKKLSEKIKGRSISEERRQRMIGKRQSEYTKIKRADKIRGRKHTDEAKQKMKEAYSKRPKMSWWTNGIISTTSVECPGIGFYPGRKVKS